MFKLYIETQLDSITHWRAQFWSGDLWKLTGIMRRKVAEGHRCKIISDNNTKPLPLFLMD